MKYKLLLSLMTLLFAANVVAQEEKEFNRAFISVQGGVMRAYNGVDIARKWSPAAAVSFGYNFTPIFGVRLQANGSQWKADLPDGTQYDSKMGAIDLDLLFNLSNALFPNRNNFINVIAVAGTPLNLAVPHTWVDNYAYATTAGGDRWNKAWKVGGQLDFNIARHFSFNIEAGSNYVHQLNDGLNDDNKWWPYAMAGITFKFGYKKAKQEAPVVVEEVYEEPVKEAPVIEKKPEPKPQVVVKPKPEPVVKVPAKIGKNIFFDLAKSDIRPEQEANLDNIARFAKENAETKLYLVGYADKNTGNAQLNEELSKSRAEAVKAALVKRGVAESRISTEWKGDTVQPFANNDDNRVVIVVGEKR